MRITELTRARQIARTLGIRAAAGFMRKREWPLLAALETLCGPAALDRAVARGIK